MKNPVLALLATALLVAAGAWGQPAGTAPKVGYLYPAGGERGAVVRVVAGGQLLRGVSEVHVSGDGVRATVLEHFRPVLNIDKEQREELEQRFIRAWQAQLAELGWRGRQPAAPFAARPGGAANRAAARPGEPATKPSEVEPVKHPLLYDLESQSLAELQHSATMLRFPRWKRQINLQIAEMVLIEVTVDPGAAVGDRDLRLETPLGLTNPMVFQVGGAPEVSELEPNDPNPPPLPPQAPQLKLPKPPPADLPVVLNGQIMPGDVDRFSFRAEQGQPLVIEARARRLIPYLADAVPGWFQATVALYDPAGNEVAFADDYRFDPDPVLLYEVPESGVYELEVRDALYRGREDFVYRIAVGEQPFVTEMFPLGGRTGAATVASISGWNLPAQKLRLDTSPGGGHIRRAVATQGERVSFPVTYAVDELPDCNEIEPNDTAEQAQRLELPLIVNGRIARPGDADHFRFSGRAGGELVAEVYGRRLGSPIDSLLRLSDSGGRVLAWSDDHEDPESGLITHHADSYLRVELPSDGEYDLELADAQQQGGNAVAYRLRVGPPRPDFALRVTPSSVNLPVRGAAALEVHVVRRDGFEGDIELHLTSAPQGFAIQGGRIPADADRVRVTLSAGWQPVAGPVAIELEGRAVIGDHEVRRIAAPAEDMMQAFAYRHLVPSQGLLVASRTRPPGLPSVLASPAPVRIPAGGAARVVARTPQHPKLKEVQLELAGPPEGVTLAKYSLSGSGFALELAADGSVVQAGLEGNLIVEAFAEMEGGGRGGGAAGQTRRVSLGVLPAIPFEIVER